MSERRKRLIEVAFPLEEVSAHSRHEKRVRHGHISTIHTWWARRPLAACRAFIYASLVDDPETEPEREALLREVADLANWNAVRHPERVVRPEELGGSGLTGTQLLKRARQRILDCNRGKAPKLLDPFAGGGAIPLEALRLGCEVEASDLNPVAVLILKGTLEYPQKYGKADSHPVPDYIRDADSERALSAFAGGELEDEYRRNPLAADVRYWGHWVLERARDELRQYYPSDPDGSVPVAYLWSRIIPCPSCHAEMPLIRQYWLARKDKKRVALEPVIDREGGRVDFRVVEGLNVTGRPEHATASLGDVRCLLCSQVAKGAQVRQEANAGNMSAALTTVVTTRSGQRGKHYREDTAEDADTYTAAAARMASMRASHGADLPLVPDEPMPSRRNLTGGVITAFGVNEWGKLFNERQLLALTTFARLVREAHTAMLSESLDAGYAEAIATYLGLAFDRSVDYNATISRWGNDAESSHNALARQALPMVWDYAEVNPIGSAGGSWVSLLTGMIRGITASVVGEWNGEVRQDTAARARKGFQAVVTDPPYYDSVNYADLSDFFYVWLKRSIGFLYPDLLSLPLTPKREQTVMNVYADGAARGKGKESARQRYVDGMAQAFEAVASSMEPGAVTGVVFAHTDPDAWSTLIEGLLSAGLVPDASWPIDTEMETRTAAAGQARLKTSVWMACRKREEEADTAFLGDVIEEMRPVIRERLLSFWGQGIRGADFFISGIGPALSVFGRHRRVLRPDGTEVSVRDFLDAVRRESTTVALEQVLQGADLGVVDPLTRQYVTWVWSYSRASLDSGEALALCLATGAPFDDLAREHSIAVTARERSKKIVKLRTVAERAREDEDLGIGTLARPAPLIDELQRAAWLWGQSQSARLGEYRGALGESRWTALLTLGQAVAECLPDGDEDRRMILGLLGATVRGVEPAPTSPQLTFTMEGADGAD